MPSPKKCRSLASRLNDNAAFVTTSAEQKAEVFESLLGHPLGPFDEPFGRQWVCAGATVWSAPTGLVARVELLAVGELLREVFERLDLQGGCGPRIR